MFSLFFLSLVTASWATPTQSPNGRFEQPRSHDLAGQAVLHDTLSKSHSSSAATFSALLNAIEVMQTNYFGIFEGTWPEAIDWTAEVTGTQLSASLSVISHFKADYFKPTNKCDHKNKPQAVADLHLENLINQYFTQITSFYFGENSFGLRMQAFDDMLWVVLGWLESIKFINLHSEPTLNLSKADEGNNFEGRQKKHNPPKSKGWYGRQFIPQFAHRARIFYDLASRGWDTSLCDGGMVWNPYLTPYKNAITNQLFIAASVGMYLHFPGDDNGAPFLTSKRGNRGYRDVQGLPPAKAHDMKYLRAAIEAYTWLKKSNMRNDQGLYVDGFHIQGWHGHRNGSRGTEKCDVRDEMVYTYNQGVILSGLKGLFEATGGQGYLDDGHELIRNVIAATGWQYRNNPERKWRWAGLGRGGIMEESCDSSGTCSQDGQTFKGIFFHHLTLFCSPLPKTRFHSSQKEMVPVGEDLAMLHHENCHHYAAWIRHNARAAYVTRDQHGKYGSWWGRPFRNDETDEHIGLDVPSAEGTDYRNKGVPMNSLWRLQGHTAPDRWTKGPQPGVHAATSNWGWDLNDRGRGRTVETQSGGVAVLRALWYSKRGGNY